ncbi:MAG: HlyD family efflux transporter periplasmic adaptor subunit [Patescibacteria group bacterium]
MHTIFSFIKSHIVVASTIVIVAVAGMAIAGRLAASKKNAAPSESNIKKVTLVDVGTFRTGGENVAADGIVESVSQVDLKSQLSAPLSLLNVAVGDTVTAGQIIAELQNADIRAQLDSAKAALRIAQGQYSSSGISLESARKGAIDKIKDSYIKADDAIRSQIDQLLSNNISGAPQLYSYISDSALDSAIRSTRVELTSLFSDWKVAIDALSPASTNVSIESALRISEQNISKTSSLLDNVSRAVNDASRTSTDSTAATIATWKALVSAARNSISAASASLTAAESTLANAQVSGGSPAQAQVSVAQAGVDNLEAQLAKTIIKSPISGKIAALPLRSGELASPGALIATVVGTGGIQVKAYASGEDFARIQKGAHVIIGGKTPGVVIGVAPSVNQTNKKVEVNISVPNSNASGLVIGQNVQVLIDASAKTQTTTNSTSYLLPMQNVKIVPGDAYVLTVDADSKIQSVPVVLGEVRGEFVEVKSGLTDGMKIVSPVYELNAGETVQVQE